MNADAKSWRIALVTRIDEKYSYIWNTSMGLIELRYPFKSIRGLEPGDFVRYNQNEDSRGVQYERDIQREMTIVMPVKKNINRKVPFGVKTLLIFPPKSFPLYQECVENVEHCRALAYSQDFGRVACFLPLEWKTDVVYEGYITRIPKSNDEIAKQVGTLFCLINSSREPVIQVTDESLVNEALQSVPWKNDPSWSISNEIDPAFEDDDDFDDILGLQQPCKNSTNNYHCQPNQHDDDDDAGDYGSSISNRNFVGSNDSKSHYDAGEPHYQLDRNEKENMIIDIGVNQTSGNIPLRPSSGMPNDVDMNNKAGVFGHSNGSRFQDSNFRGFHNNIESDEIFARKLQQQELTLKNRDYDNFTTALTVDENKGFGIIVRLEHDYSVIWSSFHEYVCATKDSSACNMPLGTWVNYKAFDDALRIENGVIKKSAYSIEEIQPKRLSFKFEHTVKCQAFVRLSPAPVNEYFVMAQDDVLGVVLCSRDHYLMKRLKSGEEIEVFAIFVENQKPSKWVAIAMKKEKEEWKKLDRLPVRINELAECAFKTKRIPEEEDYHRVDRKIDTMYSEIKFRRPNGWTGPINIHDRIEDVLGIVVAHEMNNCISVLYTIFGLVRMSSFVSMGTWMRLKIVEDLSNKEYSTRLEMTKMNYVVKSGVKIEPPMSTRVVTVDSEERLLLCGIIICGNRCFENEYLGVINDSKNLVKVDSNSAGFLVELAFMRRAKTGHRFWSVAKSHGPALKNITHVPLALSVYPNEMGRTCDDAHTVLVDAQYFASEHMDEPIGKSTEFQCRDEYNYSDRDFTAPYSTNEFSSKEVRQQKVPGKEHSNDINDLKNSSEAQWLFGDDRKSNTSEELRRYKPVIDGNKWRGVCLVVRKFDTFALAYSRKFRIILIKADLFRSHEEFQQLCEPANWLEGTITRVLRQENSDDLCFKFILFPTIRVITENIMNTRVLNNFVQVCISCKFEDDTVQRVPMEMSQCIVKTDIGKVLISESLYKKHEFHNTTQMLWVTHISEKHDCYWKFVVNDTLVNYDLESIESYHTITTNVDLHVKNESRPPSTVNDLISFDDVPQLSTTKNEGATTPHILSSRLAYELQNFSLNASEQSADVLKLFNENKLYSNGLDFTNQKRRNSSILSLSQLANEELTEKRGES